MRTIEELRTIANKMGKPLETLLYEMLSDAMEENEKYKSRNKKAVEFIKNNVLFTETYDYDDEDNLIWNGATDEKESEELLNILEGGDEN